jgi:hypothetical protein
LDFILLRSRWIRKGRFFILLRPVGGKAYDSDIEERRKMGG